MIAHVIGLLESFTYKVEFYLDHLDIWAVRLSCVFSVDDIDGSLVLDDG